MPSRVINYQICVNSIDELPAKLKEFAGRDVPVRDIHSLSVDSQFNELFVFITLWNNSDNPYNSNRAL